MRRRRRNRRLRKNCWRSRVEDSLARNPIASLSKVVPGEQEEASIADARSSLLARSDVGQLLGASDKWLSYFLFHLCALCAVQPRRGKINNLGFRGIANRRTKHKKPGLSCRHSRSRTTRNAILNSSLSFSSPLQSFSGLPPGRSANFSLQKSESNSHGFCAMKFPGTNGLWSIKLQIGERECSLRSVNQPAARRFSKMGEQNRGQRRTDRNPRALPTEHCYLGVRILRWARVSVNA